jgi:hypothetical protein
MMQYRLYIIIAVKRYMRRTRISCFLIILLLIMLFPGFAGHGTGILHAQNPGEYTASWLKIGIGARAIGMGESYTAAVEDASGIFWNPAGLSRVGKSQLMLQYGTWIAGTGFHAMSFLQPIGYQKNSQKSENTKSKKSSVNPGNFWYSASPYLITPSWSPDTADWQPQPAKKKSKSKSSEKKKKEKKESNSFAGGAIALGVIYIDNGDIIRTQNSADTEKLFSDASFFQANSYCAMASYSQALSESAGIGITAKLISETIDAHTATATAGDVGIIYSLQGNLDLGLTMKNIGTSLYNDTLPQVVKAGIKLELISMTICADVGRTNGNPPEISGGLEYALGDTLALRAGYMMGMSDVDTGGIVPRGFTVGFGANTGNMNFDIAFSGWGALGYAKDNPLGSPMRISLIFEF